MELKIKELPPSILLNMIVKDESHIIKETLEMLCSKINFSQIDVQHLFLLLFYLFFKNYFNVMKVRMMMYNKLKKYSFVCCCLVYKRCFST